MGFCLPSRIKIDTIYLIISFIYGFCRRGVDSSWENISFYILVMCDRMSRYTG